MTNFHPETAVKNRPAPAIAAELSAVFDINYAFLQVLTNPATRGAARILGLEAPVLESLRRLSRDQLRTIAAVPFLLVEFDDVSDHAAQPGIAEPLADIDVYWQNELRLFADRLFTCIWQAARNEQQVATLCAGLDADKLRDFATFSFRSISRYSARAAHCLTARLATHASVWPDLIRSAASGSREQQQASRLSVIQLSVLKYCLHDDAVPVPQRYR